MKLSPLHIARFWSTATRGPVGTCWTWTSTRNRSRYGVVNIGGREGRQYFAHRVAYMLIHGALPSSVLVCHKCDNPSCVNPAHLFTGSHADNHADRNAKGRQARGERSGKAKLTARAVRAIRRGYPKSSTLELAKRHGVSRSCIYRVLQRKVWDALP